MAHARAKLTVLGRQLLVDRVLEDGWKPADAAKAMGVSRQTAYKWLRRFRDEGTAGLEDRSSAPRRCPHQLGSEVVATIVAARLERPAPIAWPMAWAGPDPPSTGSCAGPACHGSASSTAPPAPWCATSVNARASSSMST